MFESAFMQTVRSICARNPAYAPEAYVFITEALEFTTRNIQKKIVRGKELLEGIRQYALEEFGPMALTVFRMWGIHRTEDFGQIVFLLVESNKLGKTEEDKIEDFANGYSFEEAFGAPFRPTLKTKIAGQPKPPRLRKRPPAKSTHPPSGKIL